MYVPLLVRYNRETSRMLRWRKVKVLLVFWFLCWLCMNVFMSKPLYNSIGVSEDQLKDHDGQPSDSRLDFGQGEASKDSENDCTMLKKDMSP